MLCLLQKNPFVADEAEEDEDEDNMHLALDDPDSDTEDKGALNSLSTINITQACK